MSSIYDKKENIEKLNGVRTSKPRGATVSKVNQSMPKAQKNQTPSNPISPIYADARKKRIKNANSQEIQTFQQRSAHALNLVDDIVLKNCLTKLSDMNIVPLSSNMGLDDIILFKINKMVYEKDEYATDKFISVVSAMTYTTSTICLIVDGQKEHTDFYLGIKCEDSTREKSSIAETFKDSLLGQFPGTIIDDYSLIEPGKTYSKQDKMLYRLKAEASSISLCLGIPSYKNSKKESTNANFIQGIEKFASAMQEKDYTAVILASNASQNEISTLRLGYETIYTELSAMATKQLAYSTNESLANAISRTKGTSDTHTTSIAESISDSISKNRSQTNQSSVSHSHTEGESKDNAWGKSSRGVVGIGGAIANVGVTLTATGAGSVVGIPMMTAGTIVSGVGSLLGIGAKNMQKSDTQTTSASVSYTDSDGYTHMTTKTSTTSDAHTDSFSETNGETTTIGTSKNFTLTVQNKRILEIQKRIDKQLERIEMCESTGLWSASAYFVSYGTDRATAEIASTIFRSIMQGEQSGVETSAINTWYNNPNMINEFNTLIGYVSSLSHPVFEYDNIITGEIMRLQPTSLLSSKELAILMGLPRKSVPGLPITEHISLAKEVVRLNNNNIVKLRSYLELGCIYDQGIERRNNKVFLDTKSLTQHTFVTGSTGCGKSNTIYHLIDQIRNQVNAPKFLIIEPAKGEYKDVFGNEHIYGTNPLKTPLLRINPFKFPEGIHVLEHIDRLIEIFNVCWPMYAAMPAIIKEAILNSYENCGWDLYESTNKYDSSIFPTFADLLDELVSVINNSAYSEELKSNYQGSLVTRIKSLNNGLYKQIFSGNELGDKTLFDENVIVDLSRIGSQETKSLLMGIIIMRLSEYRANSGIEHNSSLRHVTILEEAHNILKRCSQEQHTEGGNIAGKSVEMISNAIAEMRTYGEGFIIVDQSPGAVDVSAIRNTNTKIIMRLPEDTDRQVAGKASGLKDNQVNEIAKLPTGVAVVYQNDWEEPVLCKIEKFTGEELPFNYIRKDDTRKEENNSKITIDVLKLLLQGRLLNPVELNIDSLEHMIGESELSTHNKILVYDAINEYRENGTLRIWDDDCFELLAKMVTNIMSIRSEVKNIVNIATDFEKLTDELRKIITHKVSDIPEKLILATIQCLMHDYSLENEVSKRIYNAWFQSTLKKGIII